MNKIFLTGLTVIALSGCAQKVDPQTAAMAQQPVYCQGKEQCDAYWSRAKAWIAMNSGWKIQMSDETVISTYSPVGNSAVLGYQVVKTPMGGDKSEIVVQTACANMFGCIPGAAEQTAKLKNYIKAQ
ncbi:MAG: hypothetical protein RR308_16170 [Hafnia sp.]